jgi:ElaB/YqjD/DUF883 family membrane-anchored ribosome-binding protein
MSRWARTEQQASKFLKELDADDLHDQLDAMRAYLKDLTGTFGKIANRQWGRTRDRAADAAQEAEVIMKDNLSASLIVALGIGVLVGYLLRRGSQ